jgi:hypothetical protein
MSNVSPRVIEGAYASDGPVVDMVEYAEIMLQGGTEEMGVSIASTIIETIENGRPLSHSLIISAEEQSRRLLIPRNVPINRSIFERFGMDESRWTDIKGNERLTLGTTGLVGYASPLHDPSTELTEAEIFGLRKRFFIDSNGNKVEDAGLVILPLRALRINIEGVDVDDPEL